MTNETSAYNYVHPRFTWWLIPSSVWQTQLPPVCSPKCHILQHPVSNATSSCMLTQVSHVDPQLPVTSTTFVWMLIQVSRVDPQLPVTNTASACMLTQVSHVDLTTAPWDKHNFRLYAHTSVACWLINIPLGQTQLPPISSLKRHMFPLHLQLPLTNTTTAYMLTQVSHVSITSPAPCDKHNFRL